MAQSVRWPTCVISWWDQAAVSSVGASSHQGMRARASTLSFPGHQPQGGMPSHLMERDSLLGTKSDQVLQEV